MQRRCGWPPPSSPSTCSTWPCSATCWATTPCPTPSPTPTTPSPAEPRLGSDVTIALGEANLGLECLPERLRLLHRSLAVGAIVDLAIEAADPDAGLDVERLADVVTGAGFDQVATDAAPSTLKLRLRRARSLPDWVGPGMELLVCGLNPSLYAADAGVPFARRGNRFWSAALAAGVVNVAHDPEHALRHHGVGMTDLVKRATPGADELNVEEYRHGLARVRRLCAWLSPGAICFVGLAGWRAAVDRRAGPGLQPAGLSGRPVYVMPSTSGRNAHADPDSLRDHLRAALELSRAPRRVLVTPPPHTDQHVVLDEEATNRS